jgi:Rad3-related DNA helicase
MEDEENLIPIQGCAVYFPNGRKPFSAQLAVMNKVLVAAKEGKNALLESPTGTGKVRIFLIKKKD